MRKSAFELTPEEVSHLRLAFTALRNLARNDPQDPRGWLLQANIHCWYCGGGANSNQGEEIHGGYWFFPWHRAYLYVLEKILGKLVGDPTLALPYWDWDSAERNRIPPAYAGANNPLADVDRAVGVNERVPAGFVDARTMRRVMSAPSWPYFLGTPAGPASVGGQMENGPHGLIHLWTAQPSLANQCGAQDMGVLSTAARDPIFFAHHGNIDRLWDSWRAASRSHTNPTDPAWLSHTWTFYDENKQWISISVADVVEHQRRLGYVYQRPHPGAFAATTPHLAAAPGGVLTEEPQTVVAPVQPAVVAPEQPAVPQVHVDGISLPAGGSAVVRVFLNLPSANARTSLSSPNYVGYFAIVPHRGANHDHPMTQNVALMIGPAARKLVESARDVKVTLVPVGGGNVRPAFLRLSYEHVYISME